jgi:branched-chain amino acid transport system substrate-binding protein
VKGTHAVYDMSATDHTGVDKRARVLVRVENGEWKLLRGKAN